MKMKVGTRVLFTVFLLAVVALCVFLFATLLGLVDPGGLISAADTIVGGGPAYKVLYAAVFVVVLIVCFALMFFGVKKETPKVAKIAVFENGSIMITVKALEEMVERFVRDTKHVKGMVHRVTSYADYVTIDLQIAVEPDVVIPEITTELKTGLIAYIQKYTGIAVRAANVSVMNVSDNLKLPTAI